MPQSILTLTLTCAEKRKEIKVNDKTLCQASERLSGMLALYIAAFNDALDCKQHNAQVQKTLYMENVVHAVSQRILELKTQLRKLDGSNYQFLANGARAHKMSPYEAEFSGTPDDAPRSELLDAKLEEIFRAAKEERERIRLEQERKEHEKEGGQEAACWWDAEEIEKDKEVDDKEKLTEEQLKTIEMAAMIQAHERSRQVIRNNTKTKQQRERWAKELEGEMPPPARWELRDRAAKLIQMAGRIYFEAKRKKIDDCNRDKLLDIQYCLPPHLTSKPKSDKLRSYWTDTRKKHTKDWRVSFDTFKQIYLKEQTAELTEYYRDVVRDWFYSWFREIQYIHDIPEETEGGIVAIIKDEMTSPGEWLEEYKKALEKEKADKGKSSQEKKFAAQQAKREKMMQKKEEQMKLKAQALMMKKLMKNPNQHPGYNYPKSDKLTYIVEAMEIYHTNWDELDETEIKLVKKGYIKDLDISNACKEVKTEVCDYVDEDMKKELKLLRAALKTDYTNMGEKMLEPLKTKNKKGKKKKKLEATMSEHIAEQLHGLAVKDILKQYPRTSLENFFGDQNLVGDDIRCYYGQALAYAGETRSLWWERCRDVVHGNHRVLIVGPPRSGKTTLVHALASLNDAVLFEVDPCEIPSIMISAVYLQPLVAAIGKCAEVCQPSVIFIKNIHKLFYSKKPKEMAEVNTNLLTYYFIKKLFKRFNKTDKVTIIGTCVEPWLVKAAKLLKQFPVVVPIPDTCYSTVYKILYEWVTNEHSIPNDLDIQSLARELKGYSLGYIQQCLRNFLTPARIVHIASHGLKPQDVYDFILEDNEEIKVEYEKYLKWYFDKTAWGQKEMRHYEDQLEFKAALDKYAEAAAKKMKTKSGTSSAASLK
ncbi:IQ and AAA domain-containing protein 1-like isoform X2 [Plodia interpunctella]|uniref:IQ and AAA domain-containing protein 1-like isoform X2 n=1 Tax=Plodia interpunctella TaxID=58824 RepID=UPI002368E58B|nr:IQ and AAA domain-containing protein 1-like isoform X2 [Plodia interpunctella]